MKLIVTGCAGYIGGTFTLEALKRGDTVYGIDNFINSNQEIIHELKLRYKESFNFLNYDLSANDQINQEFLKSVSSFDAIVHFAGLKAVGDSENSPLKYWKNNLLSSMKIAELMHATNIKKLIFSSSATVYGDHKKQPLIESLPFQSNSTYGSTKIASELLFKDCAKNRSFDVVTLRYFNPVGCHKERIIFDSPYNSPNNLMPRIVRVALKIDKNLKIFGNDFKTRDGTGERDYIHIEDLINAHFSSLDYLKNNKGVQSFNIGTGRGITVLELIQTFSRINDIKIDYKFASRRKGDVEICFSDPSLAKNILGWEAKRTIEEMCADSWMPFIEG